MLYLNSGHGLRDWYGLSTEVIDFDIYFEQFPLAGKRLVQFDTLSFNLVCFAC